MEPFPNRAGAREGMGSRVSRSLVPRCSSRKRLDGAARLPRTRWMSLSAQRRARPAWCDYTRMQRNTNLTARLSAVRNVSSSLFDVAGSALQHPSPEGCFCSRFFRFPSLSNRAGGGARWATRSVVHGVPTGRWITHGSRVARPSTGAIAPVGGWVIHRGAKPSYLYRDTCISINYLGRSGYA